MVFVESDEYKLAYQLYLINEEYEESINILRTQGLLNEATSLQEAAGENLKAFVDKIITAIANVWGKFVEAIKNLLKSNEEFLKDNKSIILNNQVVQTKINNFYKYKTDDMKTMGIPKYDDSVQQFAENQKTFIDKYFPKISATNKEEKINFIDLTKNYFRGGEAVSIESTNPLLNIQKIYDYCLNFKNIQDAINNDIEEIKASNKKAYLKIQTIKTFSSKEKPDIKKEIFDYSKTLEYYFNEADGDNKSGAGPDIQDDEKDTNNQNTNNTSNNNDSNNKESGGDRKAENAIRLYYNICAQYLGARMTIANEAYKSYIKILKWHVSKHKSTDEKAASKSAEEKNKEMDNATSDAS